MKLYYVMRYIVDERDEFMSGPYVSIAKAYQAAHKLNMKSTNADEDFGIVSTNVEFKDEFYYDE